MEHHPKEPDLPAEKWTEEDRRKMAGSPLGQKALQWLDVMDGDIMKEIADASLPLVTPAAGAWVTAPPRVDPREQTVYQRGRLDLLREIRFSVFGGES